MRAAIDLPEKEEQVYEEPAPDPNAAPEQELQPGDPGYQAPRPGQQAPQNNGSKQKAPPMPNHPPSGYR